METEKLIRASDARKAILKADPKLAYCIDRIPGVDAVEVLRCKDCMYYHKTIGICFGKCSKTRLFPYDDDFCSYGERRTDG